MFVWLPRKIVGIKRNEKMKISILINKASVSSSASVKIPPLFLIIRLNSQISYFIFLYLKYINMHAKSKHRITINNLEAGN